jgi:hypothetical protein
MPFHSSQATPINVLNDLWRIDFLGDHAGTAQSTATKSYVTLEWRYTYYYACGVFSCGYREDCKVESNNKEKEKGSNSGSRLVLPSWSRI